MFGMQVSLLRKWSESIFSSITSRCLIKCRLLNLKIKRQVINQETCKETIKEEHCREQKEELNFTTEYEWTLMVTDNPANIECQLRFRAQSNSGEKRSLEE